MVLVEKFQILLFLPVYTTLIIFNAKSGLASSILSFGSFSRITIDGPMTYGPEDLLRHINNDGRRAITDDGPGRAGCAGIIEFTPSFPRGTTIE